MKKKTIASKVEKSWTALLVDGQGRIRRIRKFRQKLWAIVGLIAGTLILAAVMGTLYGGTLRKQMALSDEVDALRGEIVAIQQENELLKARAVRMEAQMTKPEQTVASGKTVASVSQPAEAVPPPASPAKQATVTPPAVPATPAPAATPAVVDKPKEKKDPQVDVEGLKIAYLADT